MIQQGFVCPIPNFVSMNISLNDYYSLTIAQWFPLLIFTYGCQQILSFPQAQIQSNLFDPQFINTKRQQIQHKSLYHSRTKMNFNFKKQLSHQKIRYNFQEYNFNYIFSDLMTMIKCLFIVKESYLANITYISPNSSSFYLRCFQNTAIKNAASFMDFQLESSQSRQKLLKQLTKIKIGYVQELTSLWLPLPSKILDGRKLYWRFAQRHGFVSSQPFLQSAYIKSAASAAFDISEVFVKDNMKDRRNRRLVDANSLVYQIYVCYLPMPRNWLLLSYILYQDYNIFSAIYNVAYELFISVPPFACKLLSLNHSLIGRRTILHSASNNYGSNRNHYLNG